MGVSAASSAGKEEVLVSSGLPPGRCGPGADCGMDRRPETAGPGKESRRGAARGPRRARPPGGRSSACLGTSEERSGEASVFLPGRLTTSLGDRDNGM